jgi:type II secretory pathway component PulF
MPWFEYQALTPGEAVLSGRIEAASVDAARTALAEARLTVRDLRAADPILPRGGRLSDDDLAFFNEQLAAMADAGIALDDGLAQLARDVESPKLRGWLDALADDLRGGQTLEQAIARREDRLPLLYSQVIRAGVRTGQLPATLLNLNQHLRLAGRTRRLIWEALSYPLIVSLLTLAIVFGFLMFLIPGLAEIFRDFDTELPTATVLMIGLANYAPVLLFWLAVLLGSGLLFWGGSRFTPQGRARRERVAGWIPGIGAILRASLIARFMRGVATGVGGGLPLPEAVRLGAGATGSALLVTDADRVAETAERGGSVFDATRQARLIPPLFGFCVQSARGPDALPTALGKLATAYELRAEHTQSLLRVTLLPLVIILLGGFVAFCILAMFLPLVSLIRCMTG